MKTTLYIYIYIYISELTNRDEQRCGLESLEKKSLVCSRTLSLKLSSSGSGSIPQKQTLFQNPEEGDVFGDKGLLLNLDTIRFFAFETE